MPASPGLAVRSRSANRTSLIVLLSFISVGLLWAVVSRYEVPPLIRRAYDGQSLPIFNRMITGQNAHRVEEYLQRWDRRSRRVLIDLALLGFLSVLVIRPEFQIALKKALSFLLRYRVSRFLLLVLFVLLSIELPCRVLLSFDPIFARVKGMDDASRRLEWIRAERASFQRARSYQYLTYCSTRGWCVQPGIRNATVFGNKVLNTNSKGIRGITEYTYERQPGKLRIVTLGDSFTFGDEVSDNETYSSDLATMLPNTEVLNLGVSGYGHDQMLLYFQEEGVKYHPDVVILGYVSFDADRNLHLFGAFEKPKFELSHGRLHLTNVPVPTAAEVLAREPYRLKSLDLAMMLGERLGSGLGWNEKKAQEITSAILTELVNTIRSHGAVPVFVYLPVWNQIYDLREGLTANEEFLNRYCHRQSVACSFLRPYFRQEVKKGVSFNIRTHWGPGAHMLAAQAIRDFLVKDLVPIASQKPKATRN